MDEIYIRQDTYIDKMNHLPLIFISLCHVLPAIAFHPGVSLVKRDNTCRKTFVLNMNHVRNSSTSMKNSQYRDPYPKTERDIDSRIMRLQRVELDTDTRIMKLERKINELESVVQELCSALLYSDDMALMERQARCVGDIHLDQESGTIRAPRLLRQELIILMNRNNIPLKPLMNMWRPVEYKTSTVTEIQNDIDQI